MSKCRHINVFCNNSCFLIVFSFLYEHSHNGCWRFINSSFFPLATTTDSKGQGCKHHFPQHWSADWIPRHVFVGRL